MNQRKKQCSLSGLKFDSLLSANSTACDEHKSISTWRENSPGTDAKGLCRWLGSAVLQEIEGEGDDGAILESQAESSHAEHPFQTGCILYWM